MADAQLKAIVSGELTTAENKHKPPFDFRPYCTCWFGTNHLPHTRDFSDALFRRAFIIHFNRVFAPEEQDPQLKDKLKEELPGILNLALSHLARLLKTGRWTEPASCVEAKRQWAVECDQTAQFLEDRCVIGPDEQIASKELFEAYLKWAEDAGVRKTLNRRNFINRLSKHGVKPGRNMRQRLLLGIRLDHARA
jgi:putative DNA primase/helicase